MTIRFYDNDLSEYVDVPSFSFGESNEWTRGQSSAETVGGYIAVTDRGFINRTLTGVITEMTSEQMYDAKNFFLNTIQLAMNTFYIRIPNNRASESWNQVLIPIYCDATVGGTPITCDEYTVDERIPADYEFIGPLRLRPGGYKPSARFEGIYEISLTATVEHEE